MVLGWAQDAAGRECNCPWSHAAGCAKHKQPVDKKGIPFQIQDHQEELTKAGLTTVQAELKAEREADRKPPGNPTKVGSALVYPARHFG